MTKSGVALFLLFIFADSCLASEPGPGYELIKRIQPDEHAEFFGGPHLDTVVEVYSKPDDTKFFRKSFKIVLSSLADPARKKLLFEYEREATAVLSPNGKWIVINDRPFRGQCNPRLFKQESGLNFVEVKDADIRRKAIEFFLRQNKYPKKMGEHLLPQGMCIVESEMWSDNSGALLLRISKGQTGEPIWINNWRCIYDLSSGQISTNLNVMNRGAVESGKYLTPR